MNETKSILIGMKEGGTLARLLEMMPHHPQRRVVNARELFYSALQQPFDAVIVHEELFAEVYPWEWIQALRERQPLAKVIVVTSDSVYDSLLQEVAERLALEAGFVLTPLNAAADELAVFALRELFGAKEAEPEERSAGIVAVVWSAACKDGATTVALNTAATLAKFAPSLQIGLLDLNLKNPEMRIMLRQSGTGRSNVMLRPKLQTGTLRPAELREAMTPFRRSPNLRWLPGTYRRDTAADVSPDMMSALLAVCRSTFDVTILDVSSYPDNAATVCAVRTADVRWLVARNRSSSYLWSWNEWYECYWKLCGVSPGDISLICNRCGTGGDPAEKAAAALGMELAEAVPDVPGGMGRRLAEEGKLLADAPAAEAFAASMQRLGSRLAVRAGKAPLPAPAPVRRRPGFVSMLSGLL